MAENNTLKGARGLLLCAALTSLTTAAAAADYSNRDEGELREEPLNLIEAGVTMRAQLIALAGQPTDIMVWGDDECLRYRYDALPPQEPTEYRPQANAFMEGEEEDMEQPVVAEFHVLDGVVFALGCPRDDDNDGVPDYRDDCPGTRLGAKVDARGCEITAPVAAAPAPAPAPVTQVTTVLDDFSAEGARFAFDQAELTEAARQQLDQVVLQVHGRPVSRIVIAGHTDASGPDEYNLALSRRRAEAVYDYLARMGVDPELMMTEAHGEAQPVASNATAEGRARNRRVEITVGFVTPR